MTPAFQDVEKDAVRSDESLHEPLDSLSIELGRISAEILSINSGFQAHMEQVLAQTRETFERQYQERLDTCVGELREQLRSTIEDELRKDFEAELQARFAHVTDAQKEIERVTAQLEGIAKEIVTMLDDPSIELAKVMRKRTEQAELKAYLVGLRFSIGGQGQVKTAGS
jgi:hypothetical protein